jgi:hypothetical protein
MPQIEGETLHPAREQARNCPLVAVLCQTGDGIAGCDEQVRHLNAALNLHGADPPPAAR